MKKEKILYIITIIEAILLIIPEKSLLTWVIELILSIFGIILSKKTNKIAFRIVNIIFLTFSSLAILSGLIVLIEWNSVSSEIQNLWG